MSPARRGRRFDLMRASPPRRGGDFCAPRAVARVLLGLQAHPNHPFTVPSPTTQDHQALLRLQAHPQLTLHSPSPPQPFPPPTPPPAPPSPPPALPPSRPTPPHPFPVPQPRVAFDSGAACTAHRPFHTGARFSTNALAP